MTLKFGAEFCVALHAADAQSSPPTSHPVAKKLIGKKSRDVNTSSFLL
jgi:hypothetical protein